MNKTTVTDLSALKVAFEGVQPRPTSIVNNMLEMLQDDYAIMDEAIAHRGEAERLTAILGSLKESYDVTLRLISHSNANMFNIGRRIARAKEEGLATIAADPELKKLEIFLKGKGKADKWESVKAEAIEIYVAAVIGDDLQVLAQVKHDAPELLKKAEHLKLTIEQTQDMIAAENAAADDLVK